MRVYLANVSSELVDYEVLRSKIAEVDRHKGGVGVVLFVQLCSVATGLGRRYQVSYTLEKWRYSYCVTAHA